MIGYGNSVFLRTAWEVSGGVPPVNTAAPKITGTAQEGQTVTCSTGTWTGTPTITFAYQWKRNGSNIGSATNSTYTLVTADVSQSITCQVTATNGVGSANANSNTITPIAALDPDAQAFITAAAITDPTQQAAINTLVVDLKGYSIWTKMKALYPFVGGTASQHKFNLKNPLDTNAAYRIFWYGGVTHSSNGILGNGSNGYGDTFLNNNVMGQDNAHISIYSRTNTQNFGCDIGSWNSSQFGLAIYSGYLNLIRMSLNSVGLATISNTDSRGFYLGSRLVSSSINIQKNSTQTPTSSTSTTPITTSVKILRIGDYNGEYSNRNLAFASIGDGLTNTEALNFYTAVQAFQTTLGRQV